MHDTCEFCMYARALSDAEHVLCEKKGLVPNGYRCRKQQTDLTKVVVRKKRTAKPLQNQGDSIDL